MIFIWGRKRVSRKEGYVADYCRVCHGVTINELYREGLAGHIYYMSLGRGKVLGHTMRCTVCGMRTLTDIQRYSALQKKRTQDLEALVTKTFPEVYRAYEQQIAFDRLFQQGVPSLPPEERQRLLMEPFILLNPEVEEIYSKTTSFDNQSGIGCLGTIAAAILMLVVFRITVGNNHNPDTDELKLQIFFGVILVGIIYTVLQLQLQNGRILRGRMCDILARALGRLQPSRDELDACLARCKGLGMKIGKKMKPADLWKTMMRPYGGADASTSDI